MPVRISMIKIESTNYRRNEQRSARKASVRQRMIPVTGGRRDSLRIVTGYYTQMFVVTTRTSKFNQVFSDRIRYDRRARVNISN